MKIDQNLTYCITGAAGFVGSMVTRRLIEHGAEVHVLLKKSTDTWRIDDVKTKLHIHYDDLTSVKKLTNTLTRIKPDVIYHLAARGAYPDQNQADEIFQHDLMGTVNLLQASRHIPYTLLVHTGSSSEYGTKTKPMRETDVLEPNSYYAIAKAAATHLCQYMAKLDHKPIVTARLFSVYGPYEAKSRLMPSLLLNVLHDHPVQLAAPTTARDYIYIEDVVDFLVRVKMLSRCGGQVLNLGTGKQSSLKDVVQVVQRVSKKSFRPEWNVFPSRTWDTTKWVASMAITKRRTRWQPKYSLTDGLAATWKWLQTHESLYG